MTFIIFRYDINHAFVEAIPAGCTFIQLLGVPRPAPRKRDQFYSIDLKSVQAAAVAAQQAVAGHFGVPSWKSKT